MIVVRLCWQRPIEKIRIGARALVRRRAESALISDLDPEKLETLDGLLNIDLAIGQTRFTGCGRLGRSGCAEPGRID